MMRAIGCPYCEIKFAVHGSGDDIGLALKLRAEHVAVKHPDVRTRAERHAARRGRAR